MVREFTTKDTKSVKTKKIKPLPHAETQKIQEEKRNNETQWSNAILGDSSLHTALNRECRKRFST